MPSSEEERLRAEDWIEADLSYHGEVHTPSGRMNVNAPIPAGLDQLVLYRKDGSMVGLYTLSKKSEAQLWTGLLLHARMINGRLFYTVRRPTLAQRIESDG